MAKGSRLQDFETKVAEDLKAFEGWVEAPFEGATGATGPVDPIGPPTAPTGATGYWDGVTGPVGTPGPVGIPVSAEAAAAAQAEAATARRNVDIGATGAALADPLLAAPLVLQATRDEQEKGARVVAEREKDPDLKVIP
jgi:hypothetical protein